MTKNYIITLLTSLLAFPAFAQFTSYSADEVPERYIGEVENMDQYEIRMFNSWRADGNNDTVSYNLINAARAHDNLESAPATIIDYDFSTEDDGKANVIVQLINTTPKLISEAKFTFEFLNSYGENVYDIKTANKYLTLTFHNLKGRTSSLKYGDISKTILDCYHVLSSAEDDSHNTFTNRKARTIKLVSGSIRYADGKSTTRMALFTDGDILKDGPLSPIVTFLKEFGFVNENDAANEEEDGQSGTSEDGNGSQTYDNNNASGKFYTIAEQMPSFKGNVNKWLAQHIHYPAEALENGIQGRVVVKFVVTKDGDVVQPQVIRNVDPSLDKEALRVVSEMPKWNPGYNNGEPANVWYTLPVTFSLGK